MQRSPQALSTSETPSDLWVWRTQQEISWLSCRLLEPWPHAFLTRHAHPRRPDHLATLLDLEGDRAAWAHQVHGQDSIWSGGVVSASGPRPRADAVMTDRPGHSVWVCTADCVPILSVFPQHGVVAAIHAGWRGTAASICAQVMGQMRDKGLHPRSARVAIGPAISGKAYQVSWQVAEQVLQTLPPHQHESALLPDPDPDRVRLDLKQVNRLQLLQEGVPPEQISVSSHCTRDQPSDFFSYRRAQGSLRDEDGRSRVQWSGIGIPPLPLSF